MTPHRDSLIRLILMLSCLLALPAMADNMVFKQQFGQVQTRGGARLSNPGDGPLAVSDIGSSGLDGVAFTTGRGGSIGPIRWMAPESLAGRGLSVIVHGENADGSPAAFASSFVFDDLGACVVSVDPMDMDLTGLVVRAHSGGSPLYEGSVQEANNPLFEGSAPPSGFGTTGPYLPVQPYDDSLFGWLFPGGTTVTFPGQEPLTCDMVTFALQSATGELQGAGLTLTGCEILGREPQGSTGQLLITDFPSTLFHHRFGGLGQATVVMDHHDGSPHGTVKLRNLGDGGQDGVCVARNADDTALGVHLAPMEASGGDVLRFGGLSLSPQDPDRVPLPQVSCRYGDSFFDIWVELTVNDPPTAVRYLRDGFPVGEAADPTQVARLTPRFHTSVQHPYQLSMQGTGGGGFIISLSFPQAMLFDTGGEDNDCDGIELEFDPPIGGPWYDWDAIELAALLILLGEIDIDGCPNSAGGPWGDTPFTLDTIRGIEKSDIRRGMTGNLVVDNLGSSGQDGVRFIPTGGGTGSGMGARWMAAAPLDPFRGHVTVLKAHGSYGGMGGAGGGGVVRLIAAPADTGSGEWNLSGDFSAFGGGDLHYLVYNQGQLVDTIICAGTLEECLGLTAPPVSCEVVLDSPDGQPRMSVGLPPLTRYIDKASPLLGDGPADLIEVVYAGTPDTPFTEIVALDLLMGGVDGELTVTSAGVVENVSAVTGLMPRADQLSLQAPSPNPFNPTTEIAFELARATDVSLKVFNLRGQCVRDLVQGFRPAGRFRVSWDGRDSAGRAMASGTYLFCLSGGGQMQTRKAVLVK